MNKDGETGAGAIAAGNTGDVSTTTGSCPAPVNDNL
jgi:hypothetical protein